MRLIPIVLVAGMLALGFAGVASAQPCEPNCFDGASAVDGAFDIVQAVAPALPAVLAAAIVAFRHREVA